MMRSILVSTIVYFVAAFYIQRRFETMDCVHQNVQRRSFS